MNDPLADFPASPARELVATDRCNIALAFIAFDQEEAARLSWTARGNLLPAPHRLTDFRIAAAIHYQILSARAYADARRAMGVEQ